MNVFLKKIIQLSDDLNKANGTEILMIIDDIEKLYDNHIKELIPNKTPSDVIELPDNMISHDIAKEFVDYKLKLVNKLLNSNYKVGYLEGITHFIEDKRINL